MMRFSVAQKLGLLAAVAVFLTATLLLTPASRPAPEVTFTILGQGAVPLADLRGKAVLVTFWATTCATCVAEMPELIAHYRRLAPQGFEVVAVAMPYDPPSYVARFARERALPFKVALDVEGKVARAFDDVAVTPTHFFIDRAGRIVEKRVGRLDFPALDRWVASELKASAQAMASPASPGVDSAPAR